MSVPDYQTLMLPVLSALSDGEAQEVGRLADRIAERLALTPLELQERLASRQLAFQNRVGWAGSYMRKAGLIDSPKRGLWNITARGLELLTTAPSRIDNHLLSRYPEFVKFRADSRPHKKGAGQIPGLPDKSDPRESIPDVSPQPASAAAVAEPTPGATEPLSFNDAAEQVLRASGARTPLHYRVIAQRALDLGLVRTSGRTPEATLNAQVGAEIARAEQRGVPARFVRFPKGYIGLAEWQPDGLVSQIDRQNAEARSRYRERLFNLNPAEFETLIEQLLVKMGFADVSVTSSTNDRGIDVWGTLVIGDVVRMRMAVQVKRWRNNVQAPIVQQVRGALGPHEQGLIITTSDFGPGARREAERPNAVPVGLMNGEQLVALLVEHGLGARKELKPLIQLDEIEAGDD